MAKRSSKTPALFPSKDEILAFIGKQPGKIGVREIARAFNLKNDRRAQLKQVLRELSGDGRVASSGGKLHHPGALPSVTLADIVARDSDGELIATPTEWDEAQGPAAENPHSGAPRASPGETAGVGDRALLRVEEIDDEDARYSGRVIKVIDHAKQRVLGVYRALPGGGGRLVPVDKKQLGKELSIAPGQSKDAQDGDLIAVSVQRQGRFGLPSARVEEKLGSLKSERAVSIIAIHAHEIPNVFPQAVIAEAEAAKPATLAEPRGLAQAAARHHRPGRRQGPRRRGPRRARSGQGQSGRPHHHGRHRRRRALRAADSALDREALKRGNSVYFPDRVVPMLPERISNDLCSLRPNEDRAALAVRMIVGADGRKRSHTFHRVLMKSTAKLHYAQAQAAVDGRVDDTTGPLLDPVLKPLYDAYAALKRARQARHPLDLDLPERKILLKPDGTVDRVITPERLEAHRLIEEFMILANVAAAETAERARLPLIYRVHDEPSLEKVEALRTFLETLHISLPKGGVLRGEQFNHILAKVKGGDVETLVNEIVLRTQSQAEYCRRELRPLRPQPAPLRALYIADPPLRRPHRASRADPGAEPWQRRRAGRAGPRRARRRSRRRFPQPSGAP